MRTGSAKLFPQINISKKSSVSITNQIYDQILKMIIHGRLEPGEKLPPERDLALNLGISRGTVRRAYEKLEQSGAIITRKGSGSLVLKNGHLLEESQKKEAAEIISNTFSRLYAMGLSEKEILNLVNLRASTQNNIQNINIMVVSNNHEVLSQLENQFSYLAPYPLVNFSMSYFTIDSVSKFSEPMQTMLRYDLIIASSIDYPAMVEMFPDHTSRMIEANISPRTSTLRFLASLPRDTKMNIIYRTTVFRDMVYRTLKYLDFNTNNLYFYSEFDYNPVNHGDNGIKVILNFNESPVYVDPSFKERNEAFIKEGGIIYQFEYRINREALLRIEDRIQDLLRQAMSEPPMKPF